MAEIPSYPQSRPLVLADKERFELLFRQLQPRISELTFAGLYLFRHAHAYRLTVVNDSLIILGRSYGSAPFFFPPWVAISLLPSTASLPMKSPSTGRTSSLSPPT